MDENFIIANRTDVGRTRQVNEDSMVTFDSPNGRVVAVCDGMGGQAAGDLASQLACEIITDILTNNVFDTPTEAITRAVMAANQGIVHKASQNPDLEGMGSTCVIVIIKDGLVYYGWVGDSRIYYISNGSIRQLSRDQSYVQHLVDTGQISAADAEHHPQKNEILNALGLPSMTPPELCTAPLTPEAGSVILLCSDGLSNMVDNYTIEKVVSDSNLSLQDKANKLVDLANQHGGADNITLQLVQFGGSKGGSKGSGAKKGNSMLWNILIGIIVVACLIIGYVVFSGKGDDNGKGKGADKVKVDDERTKTAPDVKSPSVDKPTKQINHKPEKVQKEKTTKQPVLPKKPDINKPVLPKKEEKKPVEPKKKDPSLNKDILEK